MKLSELPTRGIRPKYRGSKTRKFVEQFAVNGAWNLDPYGVRLDELPDEIFETIVFCNFLFAASGEFSESRSIFYAHWRWMPAAERMARKIGAVALADQLATAWIEVCTFPEHVLDEFDGRCLIWRPSDIENETRWPMHARRSTVVSEQSGERISYLLNYKWQDDIHQLPIDQSIDFLGDSISNLENALAAYVGKANLPFKAYWRRARFDRAVAEILDRMDDYEIRTGHVMQKMPIQELWAAYHMQRNNTDKPEHQISSFTSSIRSNVATVSEDGFLISEVRTYRGSHQGQPILAAYYKDKAQLIEPDTLEEVAVIDLPDDCARRPKAKERLTYAEAWPCVLDENLRPTRR